MAKKSQPYTDKKTGKTYMFDDNGHGDLYNNKLDMFLIFRPYARLVETVVHKDGSVTMNKNKFNENTNINRGVYVEGYEINDDGTVFVMPEDVTPKIKKESYDVMEQSADYLKYQENKEDNNIPEKMSDDKITIKNTELDRKYPKNEISIKQLADENFNGDTLKAKIYVNTFSDEDKIDMIKEKYNGQTIINGTDITKKKEGMENIFKSVLDDRDKQFAEYEQYYKKNNIGEPKMLSKGDKVVFNSEYLEPIKGTIIRQANYNDKRFTMNTNLNGYIIKDNFGYPHIVPDTRIKDVK